MRDRLVLPARVVDLGRREYGEVWRMQQDLLAARQRDEIPDTLLLCEHDDVLTLGRGTHRENVLASANLPVFEIERGGDVTYHGPGQLVGYPILLLRENERDLHRYLRNLEEALILALAEFGITGGRRDGWTGVWVAPAVDHKLASIGVAVKRWVTMHGFALNVATDLTRFGSINPCGLDAAVMTSMTTELGRPIAVSDVSAAVVRRMGEVFARVFSPSDPSPRSAGGGQEGGLP